MKKSELKKGFEQGLITEEKYKEELFRLEQEPKKKKRYFIPNTINDNEFKRVLDKTFKPHHKFAFQLAYLCGLRLAEVVNLKPENILFSRGLIKVVEGKGSKDRLVVYNKKIPLKSKINLLPIKKHYKNEPSCHRSIQNALKTALRKAKIEKRIRFHDLRHSYSSNLDKKGISVKTIQMMMGHGNLATTSRYLHKSVEEASKELDSIYK